MTVSDDSDDSVEEFIESHCPCVYGPCGHCTAGRHNRCSHADRYPESPAAYLCRRRRGVVLVAVWEVGHRHRWVCSCFAAHHGEAAPAPVQEALF